MVRNNKDDLQFHAQWRSLQMWIEGIHVHGRDLMRRDKSIVLANALGEAYFFARTFLAKYGKNLRDGIQIWKVF